jgi:hypothetical protein
MTTLAALAFIVGGIICIAISVRTFVVNHQKQTACTAPASAELLDYEEEIKTSTNEDGFTETTTYYYPVFRYQAQGAERTLRYHIGGKRKWEPGSSVAIRYNPQQSDTIVIDGDKSNQTLGIITLLAGLVCFAVACYVLYT